MGIFIAEGRKGGDAEGLGWLRAQGGLWPVHAGTLNSFIGLDSLCSEE